MEPGRAANAIALRVEAAIGDVIAEQHPQLWDALTRAGRSAMAREVADAFMASAPEDRALAATEVLEAWHRTWLIRQSPGYQRAVDRAGLTAEELGERVYTIEQLRPRIGL